MAKSSPYPFLFVRPIAFLIDLLIFWILSLFMGGILDWLRTTGIPINWNMIVNYAYVLLGISYFTYFDSSKSKLGSPGKRALGIHILTMDGRQLSVPRAFFRTAYFSLVFFSLDFFIDLKSLSLADVTPSLAITMAVIFFIVFSETIFYFFHPQMRTLRDLLTGTVVLKKAALKTDSTQRFPYFATALTSLLVCLFSWGAYKSLEMVSSTFENHPRKNELSAGIKQDELSVSTEQFVKEKTAALVTEFPSLNLMLKVKLDLDPGKGDAKYFLLEVLSADEMIENTNQRELFEKKVSEILKANLKDSSIEEIRFVFSSEKKMGFFKYKQSFKDSIPIN